MSLPARAPQGVPTGGQYVATEKAEPGLTLVPALVADEDAPPPFPDKVALAAAWPNRYQRTERLNEIYHAIASHPRTPGQECVAAARAAVTDTFEASGRFVSLPEDDGEGAGYVFDALNSDHKVDLALARVGILDDTQTRSFGNRLAGALHDIEIEDREERLSRGATSSPASSSPDPDRVIDTEGAQWPDDSPDLPVQDETW